MLCYMHDPFYKSFCANRGTCLVRIKKTEFEQYGQNTKLFAKVMRTKAFCSCLPGYVGSRCEIPVSQNNNYIHKHPNMALSALIAATRRSPNRQIQQRSIVETEKKDNLTTTTTTKTIVSTCPVKKCNKTCEFGYKTDYRTKCSICECSELKLSKCGVPCLVAGAETCLPPQRANSRPICVCKPGFGGSQCQDCKPFILLFSYENPNPLFSSDFIQLISR